MSAKLPQLHTLVTPQLLDQSKSPVSTSRDSSREVMEKTLALFCACLIEGCDAPIAKAVDGSISTSPQASAPPPSEPIHPIQASHNEISHVPLLPPSLSSLQQSSACSPGEESNDELADLSHGMLVASTSAAEVASLLGEAMGGHIEMTVG